MAVATISDIGLISCKLTAGRQGQWELRCDAAEDPKVKELTGKVTVTLGNTEWVGTAITSGTEHGRLQTHVVAAGGLYNPVEAKHLRGALSDVVSYLAIASGETFTVAGDTSITQWVVLGGSVKDALNSIAVRTGLTWRVLPSGEVWIGSETWPAATVPKDAIELEYNPTDEGSVWATETLFAAPGQTIDGHKVDFIEVELNEHHFRFATYWEELLTAPEGRGGTARIRQIAKSATSSGAYRAHYPATVAVCSFANQTVDVRPEHSMIPDLGGIPIRTGIPGLRVEIAAGQRVLVGFEGGDPDKPFAAPEWANNSQLIKATLDLTGILQVGTGAAQFVALENLVKTELTSIKSYLDALKTAFNGQITHTHLSASPGSPTGPPLPTETTVSASYTVGEVKAAQLKTV